MIRKPGWEEKSDRRTAALMPEAGEFPGHRHRVPTPAPRGPTCWRFCSAVRREGPPAVKPCLHAPRRPREFLAVGRRPTHPAPSLSADPLGNTLAIGKRKANCDGRSPYVPGRQAKFPAVTAASHNRTVPSSAPLTICRPSGELGDAIERRPSWPAERTIAIRRSERGGAGGAHGTQPDSRHPAIPFSPPQRLQLRHTVFGPFSLPRWALLRPAGMFGAL